MKSQWMTNIMEVSNDDHKKAYIVTGDVTRCGPYQRKYAQSGNTGLKPDGSRLENDCGRGCMTMDGSRPEMDRRRRWISTTYGWMTEGG